MTGKFYIDGIDIYARFGVVITDGGYNDLLCFPPLQEPEKNIWAEEDGIEVDLSTPVLAGKEISVSFVATNPAIEVDEFIAFVSQPGYRTLRIPALEREWKLRLLSQPDHAIVGDEGQKAVSFTLSFADDFPMRTDSYKPVASCGVAIPVSPYTLDGKGFSNYGIVAEAGRDSLLKAAAVKQNLTRKFRAMDGVFYDAGHLVFGEKDVTFKCCLVADSMERFWQCYTAFFNDLIKPAERQLGYEGTGKSYKCYYKSTSGWNLISHAGQVAAEFSLTLVFTSFRSSGNITYLLATEDNAFVSTEDDNCIDVTSIQPITPASYMPTLNTAEPAIAISASEDTEIRKRKITEMPEAGSLDNLIIPAVDRSTNRNVQVPVSRLGGSGGGEPLSGTLGGLLNVSDNADDIPDHGVVLVKQAGSETWSLMPMSDLGGGQQGVQRNLRIVNGLDSKNVSASKGEPCPLIFTFVSQERYNIGEAYEDTGERGLCQISVKNSDMGDYVVMKQLYINSGTPFTIDVAEYLTSGANNIMIKVTGEVTEVTTPAFVYTVYLTSLSLSAGNFKWWTAYMGGITCPLNIGGNVAKTLYVSMTGDGYNESYEIPIGTGIYTETAYNYEVKHPGRSGVYKLSAYVTNSDGTIRTKTISFQVICAVAGEAVKLVAVNNVSAKATNWAENTLFDYAMYDGENVTTSAQFLVTKDGVRVFGTEENAITTSSRYAFSFPMEIDTLDNSEFSIAIDVLDGSQPLITPITIPVNNKAGYSAVAGASYYLNPRTRSNRQTNFRNIVNEMDGSELVGQWQNLTWGNDGWIADTDGNNVLRLLAGSRLEIPYQPFAKECSRVGKTIELDYRIDNVTDDAEPVLTISSSVQDSFVGLNIYAGNIIMHTSALKNTTLQSIGTDTGVRIRLSLVILPTAYGNNGFNLCYIYINGKKVRSFTYANNDYFAQAGNIVIGSDNADVDLYGLRIYESGLTSSAVLQNYINWLTDNEEKARVRLANDILDSNGADIEFENTKDQYNVFVFDKEFPSFLNTSNRTGTLELFFVDNPERNVKVTNVDASGQGTSSKKYLEWNQKFKLNKNTSVVTYADGTTSSKKFKMFEGVPACASATAKKNWASSMQDHKCGSVNGYTDVAKRCGLTNEAIAQDAEVRLSVAQKPFMGFSKSINEEGDTIYVCMGEFTFGPDKGDKYCFGYDTDKFPKLISIEGSDNAPLPALFRVPWTTNRIVYNPDEEAWQYNGTNCFDFDGGSEDNIRDFIPAYNCVYQCSGRILPFDGTITDLNARLSDYKNTGYEYWTNDYNLYYYESADNKFIASDIGDGAINLKTQLVDKGYGLTTADLAGKTKEQLNALFIAAREKKFTIDAPLYWDVDDTLFHDNWVELFAGTDQRAKNTYPYSFGGKWKWRVDDADTIGPVDNQGQLTKGYSIETHDKTSTGAAIWNGETSVLHNLFETAFASRKIEMMRTMLTAMCSLGGLSSGTEFDKLYAFYKKYFLSVKEYFPHNAVNADAKRYEIAKLAYLSGAYTNDTDPITQSLGDAFSTETAWFKKRFLYIMSKYSFGTFSADGTDTIIVRAAGDTIQYEITPAIDMYPAIANGTSIVRGARTKAGEACVMNIELGGSGDQQNAIQCASYLQDIGQWHNKNVKGTMTIKGRMLRYIRLGSKTEPIVISISALTVADCVSLQELILSRISTLTGSLDLSACSHLRKLSADGTSLTQIQLPVGGALSHVEFSAYNQYLTLRNYPLMKYEGVGIALCRSVITDFLVTDCPLLTPVKILIDIMDAQSGQSDHALKRIRAVGFNETYNDHLVLDKLSELANGSYAGLSSEGLAGEDEYPVLDGTLNVYANVYQDSIDALRATFKKLALNIIGKYYIRFKDNFALQTIAQRYGDGVGVTQEEMAAPKEVLTLSFTNSPELESFDEFRYFTGVSSMVNSVFQGCTNLKSVSFPDQLKVVPYYSCKGATSLISVHLPKDLEALQAGVFMDCTSLSNIELPSGLKIIDNDAFRGSGFTSISLPESIEKLGGQCFRDTLLTEITFPRNMQYIMNMAFWGCKNLSKVIFQSTTPPTFDGGIVFKGCSPALKIYVPDESLNAYKTAEYYTSLASKIFPISSLTD